MTESKNWRAIVLTTLPPKSLALLEKLEGYAGREISFGSYPTPAEPGEVNPDAPGTEMTSAGATVRLREGLPVPAQGVTHELLHIERYWIERVPQLYPADPRNWKNCAQMENALEHLVIVPREADYGFEPHTHWNETYRKLWIGEPVPSTMEPSLRRMKCLMGWLTTAIIDDAEVIEMMSNAVKAAGHFEEAETFKRRMNEFVGSKEKLVKCLARFMKIPDNSVVMRYFDVRSQSFKDVKVSAKY